MFADCKTLKFDDDFHWLQWYLNYIRLLTRDIQISCPIATGDNNMD